MYQLHLQSFPLKLSSGKHAKSFQLHTRTNRTSLQTNLHPAEIFKLLKGEGLLVSFVSETGIIKRLQLAGSIENGFIYYRFNQGNLTVFFYYYEIIRAPNPLSPKPVRLDLPKVFCLLPRHSEKSIIWFLQWTKESRSSLRCLGTFAQPLRSLKPCCSFARLATVPLKSKLPPLVSFLARRVSFLLRHFSFLARRVSFLSRITDAFSMAHITRKKPVMCNECCSAVRCQIDGTVQHKMRIDRLLDSYRTNVISNIERNYKQSYMRFNSCDYGGNELILRILRTANYSPTCIFACSVITTNTNKHIILCRRKMFRLSACAGESIVFINVS